MEKFNMWTILSDDKPYIVPSTGKKQKKVICKCECGTIKSVMYTFLKSGRSKSCGCWTRDNFKIMSIIHNDSNKNNPQHYIWVLWNNMKNRCDYKKGKRYSDYGGRGITYDIIYKNYLIFKKDILETIGERPNNKYSLDRINNDLGYFKNNWRWSSIEQQQNNKRKYKKSG